MNALYEFAPAKINLTLHVTGQRADGYHLLDSLVVFADIGDHLSGTLADRPALQLSGPFGAEIPLGDDNLVLRAAKLQAPDLCCHFTLEKHLPPASGIGGGSSDAAAALRLMVRLDPQRRDILWSDVARLGADIPVCLTARPARMRGVGEILQELPALPDLWLLLVNPRVEVPTPVVFRALERRDNPAMPDDLPLWQSAEDFALWLGQMRNDLEEPAISQAPIIAQVRDQIAVQEGCLLARMSGSGATCFGLFANETLAQTAAAQMQLLHPTWWVAAAKMLK